MITCCTIYGRINMVKFDKFDFKKICIKNKIICFSSLLIGTSIISPLTSCGSDGSVNDIGGFDKEFGFDVKPIID